MSSLFKGFLPDVDPRTEGALLACANIVPTVQGLQPSKTMQIVPTTGAVTGAPIAAALLRLSDATFRTFIATADEVGEVVSGTVSSVFTNSAAAVSASFTALGNVALMANGVDKVSAALPTLDFAEITDAPVADLLVTASGFVMVLGYADNPAGWWSSGLFNHEAWDPDPGTQAANGTLYQTPGAITAGCQYNDDVIAFKADSLYRGRYVGVPNIWEWDVLSDTVGCIGPNAWCATPAGIIFVGRDDIYLLNGSTIQGLGLGVREWFTGQMSRPYERLTYCQYDETRKLVYIGYPTQASVSYVGAVLVYNLTTRSYGLMTNVGLPLGVTEAAALKYTKGAVTIDGLDALYASIDEISEPSDTPLWKGDEPLIAVLGSDSKLYTLTGPSASSSFTTAVFGDPTTFTRLTKVLPVWSTPPSVESAQSMTLYSSDDHWSNVTAAKSAVMFKRSFSMVKSARWLQAKFEFTSDWELVNIGYEATLEGPR